MRREDPPPAPDREQLAAAFRANFVDVSYAWDLFFVDLMLHLRRVSLDDMDVLLIVAVMGMEEKRRWQLAASPGNGDASPAPRARLNASRLADVTGIPRETIRRKLRKMERAGLVSLDHGGKVSFRLDAEGQFAVQSRYAEARDKVITGASAFAELLIRKATPGR